MRKPILKYLTNNRFLNDYPVMLDCCSGTADQHYQLQEKVIKRQDQIKDAHLDYCCDIHDLSGIQSQSQSCITLLEALEHIAQPHLAISAIERVLEEGGLLILTTVMDFPIHRYPHDYWRFCPDGLAFLLRNFKIVDFTIEGFREKPRGLWVTALKTKGDHLEHNLAMANSPNQVEMILSRFAKWKLKMRMRLEKWL